MLGILFVMGNNAAIAAHSLAEAKGQRTIMCTSCLGPSPLALDRGEFAIHKELGVPRGRLVPEAMKYLEYNEAQLMYAAAGSNVSAVRWYLSQGASADTFDENRSSPLHIACRSGSFQVVEELVNNSASLNIADCGGWTCLHVASYNSRPHIVSMLLKKGADATLVNRKGETSWDLATDESTQHVFMQHWRERDDGEKSEAQSLGGSSPKKHRYYLAMKESFPFQERRGANELTIIEKLNESDVASESSLVSRVDSEDLSVTIKQLKWAKAEVMEEDPDILRIVKVPKESLVSKGVSIFNSHPLKGLNFLMLIGAVRHNPKELANYLHSNRRLDPTNIGIILGSQSPFLKEVLRDFMLLIDFQNQDIVEAIRRMLKFFVLPQDGVMAGQIISAFAERFFTDTRIFANKESVENLAFSIIMLDFSLHDPGSSPISKPRFISSNAGMNDGYDFPESFVSRIYEKIRLRTVRTAFEKQSSVIEPQVELAASLQVKGKKAWKEYYMELIDETLLWRSDTRQVTPVGFLPLEKTTVSHRSDTLTLKRADGSPFTLAKLSDDGSVKLIRSKSLTLRGQNLEVWAAHLKQPS
mmetsp:Transcript_24179/g.42972  ORF Transcript_24179/g.42972 Transcript_24179/m.42972 type:complete len:585 (+) Transcript_24179:492-2246(+)